MKQLEEKPSIVLVLGVATVKNRLFPTERGPCLYLIQLLTLQMGETEYAASCLLTEGQPEVGPAVRPPTRGSLCVDFAATGVLCAERHTPPHCFLPAPDVCNGALAP